MEIRIKAGSGQAELAIINDSGQKRGSCFGIKPIFLGKKRPI
jgi:hypothetical protein